MNDAILKQAAALAGTPCYIFDTGVLKDRLSYLRSRLPEGTQLAYAIKANAFLVREIFPYVDRLEICSPGEHAICRSLGLDSSKYVMSGVYKTPEIIRAQIAEGPADEIYTVESETQYRLLRDCAHETGKPLKLLLRLTSGNQFGMTRETIAAILPEALEDPLLHVNGIQYFSGTQKTQIKRLKREIEELDAYLDELRDTFGYTAEELEYGPGLPVSYFEGDNFDEEAHLAAFSELLSGMRFDGLLTLELGRAIAASCGTYLTRVVDQKEWDGQKMAIVDGGIHQLTYYGQFMAMKHPKVHLLAPHAGAPAQEWTIYGSLCTVNDILVKRLPLEGLAPGDILAFENTGAYCVTEGISLFLSRDLPAVVIAREGGSLLCVRENTPADPLNTPHYPELMK